MGSFHTKLAIILLRSLQRRAAQYGVALNIGELPEGDDSEVTSDDDPARAIRLTAHAIARVADRIPFTRKINRHLEGTDAKAGLGSDLIALGTDLAQRNADILAEKAEARLQTLGDDLSARRAAKNTPQPQEG